HQSQYLLLSVGEHEKLDRFDGVLGPEQSLHLYGPVVIGSNTNVVTVDREGKKTN
ncbi:hypothetical protein STEG23_028701, partial [Scotinomys teguina]